MQNGKSGLIEGVQVFDRRVIPDGRGRILHGFRATDPEFEDFDVQEVYCSWIYPNAIKAWHRHTLMTLNYLVPVGNIKLALYDAWEGSETNGQLDEIFLGENCPHRIVQIPPGVWNGFMTVGDSAAMVISITDHVHDPQEIQRMDIDVFADHVYAYDWYASLRG